MDNINNTVCVNCDDQNWVCEAHPNKPWEQGDRACHCGAPGIPCDMCNPCDKDNPPRELAGSTIVLNRIDGWRQ